MTPELPAPDQFNLFKFYQIKQARSMKILGYISHWTLENAN